MPQMTVTIPSAGLRLAGTMRMPDGIAAGERRAAFLVLHGFGSNRSSSNVLAPSKMLNDLGYGTLAFDMRGCGESEGEHGRVICLEQVEDTRNALTLLAQQDCVEPGAHWRDRIELWRRCRRLHGRGRREVSRGHFQRRLGRWGTQVPRPTQEPAGMGALS